MTFFSQSPAGVGQRPEDLSDLVLSMARRVEQGSSHSHFRVIKKRCATRTDSPTRIFLRSAAALTKASNAMTCKHGIQHRELELAPIPTMPSNIPQALVPHMPLKHVRGFTTDW